MIFNLNTIEKIIGLNDNVKIDVEGMARDMKVTFFPQYSEVSDSVASFSNKLEKAFIAAGVEVLPFEETLIYPPFLKTFKHIIRIIFANFLMLFKKERYFFKIKTGKKIKKGVAIIMTGDGKAGNMPMDNTISFKFNPIVTIVDRPNDINSETSFSAQMDFALDSFAWHMTNLLIAVTNSEFTIYSFNASYPTYKIYENFNTTIFNNLIPKIAAPVRPPSMKDFTVKEGIFNANDIEYRDFASDIIKSGPILEKTGLYPKGKLIDKLKFKNNFYRWIGSLHLDKRNGMSYGFLARQLPVKISKIYNFNEAPLELKEKVDETKQYFYYNNNLFLYFNFLENKYILKVPDVWVLTSRSGSNKTNLDINKDILKIGLVAGKMIIETPQEYEGTKSKPSFDTKVILAHAVGNAIFASIMNHFNSKNYFTETLSNTGMALAHWHGYINSEKISKGWNYYGNNKPSVSCSSSQSAIYAFVGKEKGVLESIKNEKDYLGDIHVEPHHGTNMTYKSLVALGSFLSEKDISKLGNKYFKESV